ncbi:uncharacterized protein OCT59_007984 [Rhizophagus irregularis]|uniref:uncharacterized protein n=1 Tax=Rhizophagus irregularis TaxID=588596 RepID=UPI003316FB3A|nr:hypothetical protein OCT59_007984 [Rhizophagus irregularis]
MEICCIDLKQINYSPKKEIVGDFAKTQWCRKFYIPTWSEKEIEISIQENITTSLLETLENKFELCGGIARWIYSQSLL